jgi:hypothetical protein
MPVVLARLRMPLIYLGLAAIAVDSFLWDLPRWPLLALLAVAFAIYLRLGLAWWPLAGGRPTSSLGFGQPVLAPADATVARAHDAERDHWSRTSPPAMLYQLAEGTVRELLGPGRILGNHLVLDLGGGVYAVPAHLRRGSVRVRPGDRVAAGQRLAACGNSGNSTEPHLHVQLMDHPSVLLAAGLPMAFDRFQVAGADQAGLPGNLEAFTAGSR